jgi:4,4'-diaponeurosporenoate glycosyltransferase
MLLFISSIIIAISLICGLLMLWRFPQPGRPSRNLKKTGSHEQTLDLPKQPAILPAVSIIIPARNEEHRLPPLLESLRRQNYNNFELIVVDDQSDDQTGKIATAAGAMIIRTERLEDSWIGKSYACWSGAEAASGTNLVFLDADTRLETSNSLSQIVRTFQEMGSSGILSFQPYHQVNKLYESLSALFNIIVIAGMNCFSYWQNHFRPAGSFGPCIVVNRNEYFALGGHKKISDAVMDDLALGSLYLDNQLQAQNCGGRDLISFRMYPEGFRQLFEGWTKSFGTASASTHPLVFAMIIAWISGGFSTIAIMIRSIMNSSPVWLGVSAVTIILYMLLFIFQARRAGNFQIISLIVYPVHYIFFTILFMWSLFRTKVLHTVNWRGRKIKV